MKPQLRVIRTFKRVTGLLLLVPGDEGRGNHGLFLDDAATLELFVAGSSGVGQVY